jgi:hypothetical protein
MVGSGLPMLRRTTLDLTQTGFNGLVGLAFPAATAAASYGDFALISP